MHRDLGRGLYKGVLLFAIVIALTTDGRELCAQTPDEGTAAFDGGGQEVLQSIFVPYIANAPFNLTLTAEWSRPMNNGGTFTTANSRPIKRDRAGRIYQERWLMSPKGSNIPSQMSWIQIADPVAHTLYQCSARQKICELLTWGDSVTARLDPAQFKSGTLKDNKGNDMGTRMHEDLGAQFFAGLLVHEYKGHNNSECGGSGKRSAHVDGATVSLLLRAGLQSEFGVGGAADREANFYCDGDHHVGA